jgi:hypothetical protein
MAAKKTKRRTKGGKTKRGTAARKTSGRKTARKSTRGAKTDRSAAKRKSASPRAKKSTSAARRSLQRVSIVAKQVAQQAQSAVSGGVDALREMGENIVERVGG